MSPVDEIFYDPLFPPEEQGHDIDEEGSHDAEECELCIERNHSVSCACRCGRCCESLLIEVSVRDAEREARIAEQCRPIYDAGVLHYEQRRELIGYLLNSQDNGGACTFFDRETRQCIIRETRPLVCRVFNCDNEQVLREHLLFDTPSQTPATPRQD